MNQLLILIDPTSFNELDALVAHLYGLTRGEFAHILGAFPLVFPEDAQGKAKRGGAAGGV